MRDQCDYPDSFDKAQNAEEERKKLVAGLAEVYAMRVPTGALWRNSRCAPSRVFQTCEALSGLCRHPADTAQSAGLRR